MKSRSYNPLKYINIWSLISVSLAVILIGTLIIAKSKLDGADEAIAYLEEEYYLLAMQNMFIADELKIANRHLADKAFYSCQNEVIEEDEIIFKSE